MNKLKNKNDTIMLMVIVALFLIVSIFPVLFEPTDNTNQSVSNLSEYQSLVKTHKQEVIGKVIRKEKIDNLLIDEYYLILEDVDDSSYVFSEKVKSEDYVLYASGDIYIKLVTKTLPITVLAKDKITYEDEIIYFSKISTEKGKLILRVPKESYHLIKESRSDILRGGSVFPEEVGVHSIINKQDPYYDLVLKKINK